MSATATAEPQQQESQPQSKRQPSNGPTYFVFVCGEADDCRKLPGEFGSEPGVSEKNKRREALERAIATLEGAHDDGERREYLVVPSHGAEIIPRAAQTTVVPTYS